MLDENAGRSLGPMFYGLIRNAFVRNVAVLMSGTVVAQALTVAAMPILTRLYHPDEFGVLGLFVAGSEILVVMASWKYASAIMLAKDDENAANILVLSCSIVALMAVLSGLTIALTGDSIVQLLNSPAFAPVIWWLPAAVFAGGLVNVFGVWVSRQKKFKRISSSEVLRAGGAVGIQIFAGLAGTGVLGLVSGNVVGRCLALAALGKQIYREDRDLIHRATKITKMKEMALEHYRFPLYTMPQSLLNAISDNIPVIFLAFYFDSSVAGLYWFARRLLQMPTSVVGEAARKVFYQHIVEIHHSGGDLLPNFTRVTLGLAAIGIVPMIVILAFGPTLFDIIFGSAWYQAGVYARWLVIGWFFLFINVPSRVLVPVMRLQHKLLFYDVALLIFRIGAIVLGGRLGNDVASIASFAIVGAVFDIAFVAYMFNVARRANVPIDVDNVR